MAREQLNEEIMLSQNYTMCMFVCVCVFVFLNIFLSQSRGQRPGAFWQTWLCEFNPWNPVVDREVTVVIFP